SQLVTTVGAGVTQGANYTWDTAGYYLYFKGLPDKSNDTTFNKVVVRDANGQLAESNGKQLLLSMSSILNIQERTRWFSQFNDLVSWSGSSVRTALPPVISRNEKHQNILISGIGLNLVGNTAGTPEHLKSYVGLIAPDGSKINSSNYGI
ncbi:hypothetical protein PG357_10505, partial [Riemerella anatipestifer]|nr:hypothetical protein [Riemerella anatipestifer]